MSLMGTLAKVALGYAAARGVDATTKGGGLGALLGGGTKAPMAASDPRAQAQAQMTGTSQAGNPLTEMMSKLQGGAGGSGFDLSKIMGGGAGGAGGMGGLGALLGGAGGGAGLAGILAAATGAMKQGGQQSAAMLDQFEAAAPQPEAEALAGLMLRAMIMAAKADGEIDASERSKILDSLGDNASEGDMAFVQSALDAPVNPEALAQDAPGAMAAQVYTASLMTINLDTQAEAQYLDRLGKALGLDEATVNTLHLQMGATPLYG